MTLVTNNEAFHLDNVRHQRSLLVSNGYRPVAVYSHDSGVDSAGKRPKGNDWNEGAYRDSAPTWDARNTGILCDGLVAVDIDIDDPALADSIATLAGGYFPGGAPCRTRADSSRRLLLYRASEGEPASVNPSWGTGRNVEVLGHGKQFVAYGSHPTGQPYEWDGWSPLGIMRDDLTPVTQTQVHGFLAACAALLGVQAPGAQSPSLPIGKAVIGEPAERDRAYAAGVLKGISADLRAMKKGDHRNHAANKAGYRMGGHIANGSIDANATGNELMDAMRANGYTAKRSEKAAYDTIMSGIKDGMEKPFALIADDDGNSDDLAPMIANAKAKLNSAKPAKSWPTPLHDEAYIGIAGEFIRLVAPQTEGDPCALLIAFLTIVGSFVGRGAYLSVGATEHYANLFSVVVAETSKGRKGTVMNEAQRFAKMIDPTVINRMKNGLSSGEGLIEHIRDPIEADIPIKEGGKITGHQRQVVDIGITDKRLIVTEDEMGQALTVASREGNTLSATLRLAWDSKILATMARNNKNVCKEPYVSILGNITLDELKRLLTATDSNNGFGNRFLWVCAKRSRLLPFGGDVNKAALQELANKAAHVINASTHYGKCGWQSDAASMWAKEYTLLSSGRGGLAGAMSARAEAQTLRLALIYAILDGCNNVDVHHLRAALEVWRYCQDSVDYCFETSSGNVTADRILNMLASMPNGASRSQVSKLFNGNKSKDELQLALDTLKSSGKARLECPKINERGRPLEMWFAC